MRTAHGAYFLLAAALCTVSANAQRRPGSFDFAETKIARFEIKATTEIEWTAGAPYIAAINCEGGNEDVRFTVNQAGRVTSLDFTFDGPLGEDGDRESITALGDTLWLFVDRKKLEFHNVGTPTNRFLDYTYPPEEDREILLIWTGYRAVRTSVDGPLIDMTMFYNDIVTARKIEWGFKSRNWNDIAKSNPENALPVGWEKRRYRIANNGLREAVDWCSLQVQSDAARRLPAELSNAKK